MKDPMNYIERFCYKHPYFGVKNLMRYVVIANIAFWLLGAVNPVLMSYLSFDPALILRGQVWRLVTFVLYPPSTGLLAFIAFYFYYWIGSTLEQHWGTPQFNIYFFSGVFLTILYGFLMYFITGLSFRLDAQYIYLSMFFSFAALFPNMEVLHPAHQDKIPGLYRRGLLPAGCDHRLLPGKSSAGGGGAELPDLLRRGPYPPRPAQAQREHSEFPARVQKDSPGAAKPALHA